MIPIKVPSRVFRWRHAEDIGTCFAIAVDGRQYLITAKHIIDETDPASVFDPNSVSIMQGGDWKPLKVVLVGFGTQDSDIAILSTERQLSPALDIPYTLGDIVIGQDTFFLGFPYGFSSNIGDLNNGFPYPFFKKGCVSALSAPEVGRTTELHRVWLDGHNNRGFSGGPVTFTPIGRPLVDVRIGAVVSSYVSSEEHIEENGKPSGLVFYENTGIVECHSIQHAIEAIALNPIGVKISV